MNLSRENSGRVFVALGAVCAAAAVLLGAAGAHWFRGRLGAESMKVFETALLFHFFHALGLILVGIVAAQRPRSLAVGLSGWLMLAGVFLFSGSLYAYVLAELPALRRVTPWGGMAFTAAWLALAVGAVSSSSRSP